VARLPRGNLVDIMRVLLVEDSANLRHLFARVLKGIGFEVCEAANGREALECLAGFEPDVVLTDLMMPEVDGFELIRRLRAMPSMAEVPIVAMTAAATTEAEREARRAGAPDLLAKPFDSRALLDRLDDLCP
jgi:CheY-like chemotaxis protein